MCYEMHVWNNHVIYNGSSFLGENQIELYK